MVGQSPFLSSFGAGVLSVLFACVLASIAFVACRYIVRRRSRREPSNNAIPLTTLEDGFKVPDVLDNTAGRSPSAISPSSAPGADEASEAQTQGQFLAKAGTAKGAQNDGRRPFSGTSQSSAYIVNSPTFEGVEQVDDRTIRPRDVSTRSILSYDGNRAAEYVQPRSYGFPSPHPRLAPVPGRFSVSTVWSQESMWLPHKMPTSVPDVPVPPLVHLSQRRVAFQPSVIIGSRDRRSTASLPRSVGQSDSEEY
ncbi:hypothetical protein BC827DRAFT_162326 [Russula dissimulans]|jgi:hypothetical protein|nr:hypothetical protein BC827DRAFT_162326 [Russula dissimulans]